MQLAFEHPFVGHLLLPITVINRISWWLHPLEVLGWMQTQTARTSISSPQKSNFNTYY